jgi:hypothetical protein
MACTGMFGIVSRRYSRKPRSPADIRFCGDQRSSIVSARGMVEQSTLWFGKDARLNFPNGVDGGWKSKDSHPATAPRREQPRVV